jgi:hypothetical protein
VTNVTDLECFGLVFPKAECHRVTMVMGNRSGYLLQGMSVNLARFWESWQKYAFICMGWKLAAV